MDFKQYFYENINQDIMEYVKNKLNDEQYDTWKEYVDNQFLGDCQHISKIVELIFPKMKRKFGSIKLDKPLEEEYKMTHHWNEYNGEMFNFAKGTTKNYIGWENIYSPVVGEDKWRYK